MGERGGDRKNFPRRSAGEYFFTRTARSVLTRSVSDFHRRVNVRAAYTIKKKDANLSDDSDDSDDSDNAHYG